MSNRDQLRRQMRRQRDGIFEDEANQRSVEIEKRAIALLNRPEIQSVLLYFPIRREVKTQFVANWVLDSGRALYYPRMVSDCTFEIVRVSSFSDLRLDRFGIMEPTGEADSATPDAVLCPGVAFDRNGGRLGYGAGCYDRFLCEKSPLRIGLAYDFQVVETVFPEPHDVPMEWILTEHESIQIAR